MSLKPKKRHYPTVRHNPRKTIPSPSIFQALTEDGSLNWDSPAVASAVIRLRAQGMNDKQIIDWFVKELRAHRKGKLRSGVKMQLSRKGYLVESEWG